VGEGVGEGPLRNNQGVNNFADRWSLFGEKARSPAF